MNNIMTHIVAGYPDMKTCEETALKMMAAGVSFLEIQIPFSDPVADGPTILQANQIALEKNTTPEDCFSLMRRLSKKSETPLLFMTYFNIPFHYGLEEFCKKAAEVGCYGFIIPDIPYDEEPYEHYLDLCKKYKLHAIQVVSPLTPPERLQKISEIASGFVYCVARTGTTGARSSLSQELPSYLKRVRKYITLPLAVGFGISSKKQVQEVLDVADIAVIGSKCIQMTDEGKSPTEIARWLDKLL